MKVKEKRILKKKEEALKEFLFGNLLGAYTVIKHNEGIYPVDLVDLSHDGCLFQIPWNFKKDQKLPTDEEINMRIYFTKQSYIPVIMNVKYGKEHIDKDGNTYMQYGCEFDQSYPSFEAMKQFISFVYSFAEHSSLDRGDQKVYFL